MIPPNFHFSIDQLGKEHHKDIKMRLISATKYGDLQSSIEKTVKTTLQDIAGYVFSKRPSDLDMNKIGEGKKNRVEFFIKSISPDGILQDPADIGTLLFNCESATELVNYLKIIGHKYLTLFGNDKVKKELPEKKVSSDCNERTSALQADLIIASIERDKEEKKLGEARDFESSKGRVVLS